MRRRSIVLTCLMLLTGVATGGLLSTVSRAQESPRSRTVWDGLYTEAQALRGKEAYQKACAECHMPDLAGHEFAGALAGYGFQLKWEDASLAEVYGRIRTMPLGRGGTLAPQEYLDITAYVLQQNGYRGAPGNSMRLSPGSAGPGW